MEITIMPEDRIDPQPHKEEDVERTENKDENQEDRFMSDTQRIVRRHLENENDVITDEDIAGVRIGMTPPVLDEPTKARFEDEEVKDEVEEEYVGDEDKIEEGENPKDNRVTPWDTLEE
jgi:hypothetical protein